MFAIPMLLDWYVEATEEAARRLGIEVQVIDVPRSEAFDDSLPACCWRAGPSTECFGVSIFQCTSGARLADLALAHRVPAMYKQVNTCRRAV